MKIEKYKCDMCGVEFFKDPLDDNIISVDNSGFILKCRSTQPGIKVEYVADLCEDCREEFTEFLERRKHRTFCKKR